MLIEIPDETEEEEKKQTDADKLVTIGLINYRFTDQHGVVHARVTLEAFPDATYTTYTSSYLFKGKNKDVSTSTLNNTNSKNTLNNTENTVSGVSGVRHRLVTLPMHSSLYKEYLADRFYSMFGKVAGSLNLAITTLSGRTRRENNKHRLYNRVAPDPDGNGFWIDMCDKNWRAIHVTEEGWKIVDNPPVLFKRFKHQKSLAVPIVPTEGKEADTALKFLEFLNLRNETDKILFMCAVISYFVPDIEHPGLCVAGDTGSAKSMFFELTKKLIDPSVNETISISDDEACLAQQLYHNYFVCFDNLGSLKTWKSDMLCRAVTGAGFSKRKLYTDDEDIIYQFYRCIGLNGINVAVRKSDLMDRLILFKLERFTEIETKEKKKLFAEFEKERGKILGAILAILSKAIKLEKEIELTSYKRLADFHKWGCAISQALDYGVEKFNDAYTEKVELQNEEVLSASSTATALLGYLKDNLDKVQYESESEIYTITMAPTEWFKEVTDFAKKEGIKTSKGYWAGDASHFVRRLNEVKPNLEKVGITIQRYTDGSNRSIIIDVTKLMVKPESDDFWDKVTEGR